MSDRNVNDKIFEAVLEFAKKVYIQQQTLESRHLYDVVTYLYSNSLDDPSSHNEAWGEYEELPEVVAVLLNGLGIDIADVVIELGRRTMLEEKADWDNYFELQQEKKEVQE